MVVLMRCRRIIWLLLTMRSALLFGLIPHVETKLVDFSALFHGILAVKISVLMEFERVIFFFEEKKGCGQVERAQHGQEDWP